jgi:hypothetical protein
MVQLRLEQRVTAQLPQARRVMVQKELEPLALALQMLDLRASKLLG